MIVLAGDNLKKPEMYNKTLENVLYSIRTSKTLADKIKRLRELTESEKQDFKRNNLEYFTLAKFKDDYCNNDNFIESEFFVFDLDKIPADMFEIIRSKVRSYEGTYISFISPSGNGIKAICRLAGKITALNTYKSIYRHYLKELESVFGYPLDGATIDPARRTLLSYDPDLYLNENSIPLELIEVKQDVKQATADKDELDTIELKGVIQGQRQSALIKLIGRYIGRHIDLRTTKSLLLLWNKLNRPPLPEDELIKTIEDSFKKWYDNSNQVLSSIPETPQSFATVLESQYRKKVKYNHTSNKWMLWNEKTWQPDELKEIYGYLRGIIFAIRGHILSANLTPDDLKKWERLLKNYERPETKEAILKEASSLPELATETEDYDNQDNLFNVSNGTIELNKDGFNFREQRQGDYLTKIVEVEYNPDATAEKWDEFLKVIFNNDSDLIRFIQKCIGYSLSTSTDENCFFFIYGLGKNGKSTFIEIIEKIFGDYFLKASASVIMRREKEGIPNDIARLKGSRFVSCSEIDEGKALNESTIKDLTGGDRITARYLHQEYFEFYPQFKLWIYGNHKPRITGTDEGIKRRVRLIPFENTIPETIRKPKEIIMEEMKAELSGILNWALEGYVLWRCEGLKTCSKVTNATNEYFNEQDILQNFIDEYCEINPFAEIKSSEIYDLFKTYLHANGEREISQKMFTGRLKSKGFDTERTRTGMYWKGIGLNQDSKEEISGEYSFIPEKLEEI
ncbi:MAG: hypothetical protein GXX85_13440 [Ignavibacteria bacterium]|nr:hypothetical protein [Ignavibacteria bacterium]